MICKNDKFQSNCAECIKAHVGCSWCVDPDRNLTPGAVQLQPQKVNIQMSPGETVSFKLKYLHMNAKNKESYILNSETGSKGLQIHYENDCKGGKRCHGIRMYDTVTYRINVTLVECIGSPPGDAVLSIGIQGLQREVLALIVTPLCDCECYNLNAKTTAVSAECSNAGHLLCGTCVCRENRTGDKCQCKNDDDKCRQSATSAVCSGRGTCDCGQCKCDDPGNIKGEFCECDVTSCPLYEGIMCAGKGTCDCGKCICDTDRTGQICECPVDNSVCTKNGVICSNNGDCQCGSCVCNDGYDGDFCETIIENEYDDEDVLVSTHNLAGDKASTYKNKNNRDQKNVNLTMDDTISSTGLVGFDRNNSDKIDEPSKNETGNRPHSKSVITKCYFSRKMLNFIFILYFSTTL
uniref:Integrin beta n=1 Tax=Romanomermis culicivorax TaxID=13658 RepID=A0A915HXG7_ROMCU